MVNDKQEQIASGSSIVEVCAPKIVLQTCELPNGSE